MKITCLRIKNFRRLENTLVDLESDISIFVGANNSGKTSATHVLDMFINAQKDKFSIYDFTSSCWASINAIGDQIEDSIANNIELPTISLDLWFEIGPNDLHRVLDLLPGLNWAGSVVGLRIQFQPKNTTDILKSFKEAQEKVEKYSAKSVQQKYMPWPKNLIDYLGKNLTQEYELRYYGLDQAQFDADFNQNEDYIPLSLPPDRGKPLVKSLLRIDTLHAQRHLSDQASNARAEDLSKCLSRFYKRNLEKREEDHDALSALYDSESQFNDHLKKVFTDTLLRLGKLGYPGVSNPHIIIKSALNPTTIMSQDTRVHYSLDGEDNGLTLPDNYNGLGFKNLIYMVVELLDIQAQWIEEKDERALLQLIVIEEPEAHLHAQLQQVFIRQILDLLKIEGDDANYYSTQLAITTHSPHLLFEKGFKPIRYFRREGQAGTHQHSIALNLSNFYKSDPQKDFLERYMKLTHCDLFFADAAILVEGNVERLLMPLMIEKCADSLKSSYVSILEVGGAYAFRFKTLIEFLGIPALVITDLDSVEERKIKEAEADVEDEDLMGEIEHVTPAEKEGEKPVIKKYMIGKACLPHLEGAITANSTLSGWLPKKILIKDLLQNDPSDSIQMPSTESQSTICVTYQREVSVEWNSDKASVAGRTLEEAFALENRDWCQDEARKHLGLRIRSKPATVAEFAESIHKRVKSDAFNKTNFALGILTEDPVSWKVPDYIKNGLEWLAEIVEEEVQEDETLMASGEERSLMAIAERVIPDPGGKTAREGAAEVQDAPSADEKQAGKEEDGTISAIL